MQLKSPHYNHAQLPHLVTLTGDLAAAAPQHWMLSKLSKPCSASLPCLYPSLCCPRLHPLLSHFLVGGLEGVAVREAAAAPDPASHLWAGRLFSHQIGALMGADRLRGSCFLPWLCSLWRVRKAGLSPALNSRN